MPCIGSVHLKHSWSIDIRLAEDGRWDIKLTTAFDYFFFKLYVTTIHDFLDL